MATFLTTSWRTLGNAATLHNILTINNQSGSGVTVRIRRMTVQLDATVALTAVMPQVKVSRTTVANPAGGTALAKATFAGSGASAAGVVVLGATASDGGVATAITTTGVTIGAALWQQYCMRLHTAVGQVLTPDNSLMPVLIDDPTLDPFVLPASPQGLIVQVIAAAGTSNPATNHWILNLVWEEV
jgi:hypothetical protein